MTGAEALAALEAKADPERAAQMAAYHKAPRRYLGLHTWEETYNLSVGTVDDDQELHVTAFALVPYEAQGNGSRALVGGKNRAAAEKQKARRALYAIAQDTPYAISGNENVGRAPTITNDPGPYRGGSRSADRS